MRILVAEDVEKVSQSIAAALHASGFLSDIAADGEDVWFKGSTGTYSAIILDLGLPKLDGLSILKRWRQEGITTPVIILSARGTWSERVAGIDIGADDYLAKPFEMAELLSRVRALVRRNAGQVSSVLTFGELTVDLQLSRVTLNGAPVSLTPLEFRLVQYLATSNGRAVSQVELADNLYDHDHDRDANAVEAAISRVRRKLGSSVIQNKRGFGYFIDG